jgi:hypothetical protein
MKNRLLKKTLKWKGKVDSAYGIRGPPVKAEKK